MLAALAGKIILSFEVINHFVFVNTKQYGVPCETWCHVLVFQHQQQTQLTDDVPLLTGF